MHASLCDLVCIALLLPLVLGSVSPFLFFFLLIVFSTCDHWCFVFWFGCCLLSFFLFLKLFFIFLFLIIFLYFILITLFCFIFSPFPPSFLPPFFFFLSFSLSFFLSSFLPFFLSSFLSFFLPFFLSSFLPRFHLLLSFFFFFLIYSPVFVEHVLQ